MLLCISSTGPWNKLAIQKQNNSDNNCSVDFMVDGFTALPLAFEMITSFKTALKGRKKSSQMPACYSN